MQGLVQAEENIKVVVRIRPLNEQEKARGETSCVRGNKTDGGSADREEDDFDYNEVQVRVGPHDAQMYNCNRCFPAKVSQSSFFNECGLTGLLDSAIGGYRACAFAFGQTGAGKTYTIVGPGTTPIPGKADDGILGNSLLYLYRKLDALGVEYKLRLSCMEIYKEQVFDLLASGEDRKVALNVREHTQDGFFCEGCTMLPCRDAATAFHALDIAMQYRRIGTHDMNSRSNRSHCMTDIFIELPGQAALQSIILAHKSDVSKAKEKFKAKLQKRRKHAGEDDDYSDDAAEDEPYSFPGLEGLQKEMENDREYTVMGRITLIDLAGSENMKRTNSTGKQAVQEAGFINKSLYVLGQVIQGLAKLGDMAHRDVPFRDSKLTKLLISSLGGQSRTLLLACVAEASGSTTETLRTLKFSMSCARIKNRPVRFLDPKERLIIDLRSEIRKLRSENEILRKGIVTQPQDSNASRRGGVDDPEERDQIMPMRRAASANPTLQPLGSVVSAKHAEKNDRIVKGSASMVQLKGKAAVDDDETRGRDSSSASRASRVGSRSRSRSTAGKKMKKVAPPPEAVHEERSVRSVRSVSRPVHSEKSFDKSDRAFAKKLGLPADQLERVMNKKPGGSRLRSRIQGTQLEPVRQSKNGRVNSKNNSHVDDLYEDGEFDKDEEEDVAVLRIRQLEDRLRRIEKETGIASSDLLGIEPGSRSRSRSPVRKKKSPKKSSPKKGGEKALRLKKSNPHLKNVVADPSLGDLLSAVGADSDSEEDENRSRKARVMVRNIKGDNSSLSMNSGGRFSSKQQVGGERSRSKSRSVTRRLENREPSRARAASKSRPVPVAAAPSPKKSPHKFSSNGKPAGAKRYEEKWKRKKSDPVPMGEDGDWGRVRMQKGGDAAGRGRGPDTKAKKSANTSSPYIYHLVTSPPGKGKGGVGKAIKQTPEEIRQLKYNIGSGNVRAGNISAEKFEPAKTASDLITNMTKRRLQSEYQKELDAEEAARKIHYQQSLQSDQVTPDLINQRHLDEKEKSSIRKEQNAKKKKKKKKVSKTTRELNSAGSCSGSSENPSAGSDDVTPEASPPPTPPIKKSPSVCKSVVDTSADEEENYGDEDFEKEYADEDFEDEGEEEEEGGKEQNTSIVSESGDDDSINRVISNNMAHHNHAITTGTSESPTSSSKLSNPSHSFIKKTTLSKASAHVSPSRSGNYSNDDYDADNLSPPPSPPQPSSAKASPAATPNLSGSHSTADKGTPSQFQSTVPSAHSNNYSHPHEPIPAVTENASDYGIYDEHEDFDGSAESYPVPAAPRDSLVDSLGDRLDLPGEKKYKQKAFYTKGEVVEGNYRQHDTWYPGVIGRSFPDGTYEVDYDDGEHERLEKTYIRVAAPAAVAAHVTMSNGEYQHSAYLPSAEVAVSGSPPKSSGMSYGTGAGDADDYDGYSFTSKYGNKNSPAAAASAPVSSGYQPSGYQPSGYQPSGYQPSGYQPVGVPAVKSSGMSYGTSAVDANGDDGYSFTSKYGNKNSAAAPAPISSGYQPTSSAVNAKSSGMSYGAGDDSVDDGYSFTSKYGNKNAPSVSPIPAPISPKYSASPVKNPFKLDSDSDSEEIGAGGGLSLGLGGKGWGQAAPIPQNTAAVKSPFEINNVRTQIDEENDDGWGGGKKAPTNSGGSWQEEKPSAGGNSWQTEKSDPDHSRYGTIELDVETGNDYEESFDDYDDL